MNKIEKQNLKKQKKKEQENKHQDIMKAFTKKTSRKYEKN